MNVPYDVFFVTMERNSLFTCSHIHCKLKMSIITCVPKFRQYTSKMYLRQLIQSSVRQRFGWPKNRCSIPSSAR